jgi:dihydropteroate synthase
MGVLNVTPDSFSDGGVNYLDDSPDVAAVRERALAMLAGGADVLDVGGESTRPGAEPVGTAEELRRVMPIVESLLDLDAIVSVDTCKPEVARAVLAAGCHMINDVSGLGSAQMREALGESRAAVCIMHMQGEPRTMQSNPKYGHVVGEVRAVLSERVIGARAAGMEDERICIDPGFGFGKTLDHNLELLRNLEKLRIDDLPIIAGLSRKQMIGAITDRPVAERLAGSVTAAVLAAQNGADLIRVHDVRETADALKVLEAVAL